MAFSISLSIVILHFVPKRFMAQMVKQPLAMQITPSPRKSQPLVMTVIKGSATIVPTQEKMFLTKLFNAIPCDAFRGMNSVSIVVISAKISMLPIRGKGGSQQTSQIPNGSFHRTGPASGHIKPNTVALTIPGKISMHSCWREIGERPYRFRKRNC